MCVQIVPHSGGRSRDLLCLHEGGVVAHAEGEALHRTLLEAAHAAADDGALEDLGLTRAVLVALYGALGHSSASEAAPRGAELFCAIWLAQGARCQHLA